MALAGACARTATSTAADAASDPLDVPVDVAQADPPDAPAVTDAGRADAPPGEACPDGMRLVPAGRFLMGDPEGLSGSTLPVHGVRLSAYCLDATEVTTAAYGACVAARACTVPRTGGLCNHGNGARAQQPINCVTWYEARAFCQWRGGDLPTEAQWEYAARGTTGRRYPWGDDAPAAQACWNRDTEDGTCRVRSFPADGVVPGVYDLGGNVAEWVLDWIARYTGDESTNQVDPSGPDNGDERVKRGGAWLDLAPTNITASRRQSGWVGDRSYGLGMRCVAAPR